MNYNGDYGNNHSIYTYVQLSPEYAKTYHSHIVSEVSI